MGAGVVVGADAAMNEGMCCMMMTGLCFLLMTGVLVAWHGVVVCFFGGIRRRRMEPAFNTLAPPATSCLVRRLIRLASVSQMCSRTGRTVALPLYETRRHGAYA